MENTTSKSVETDFVVGEAYYRNPYEQYARFREMAPVVQDSRGFWMSFGYDDVKRVVSEHESFGSALRYNPDTPRARRMIAAMGEGVVSTPHLTRSDPPEHRRLRRHLARWFTPGAVSSWSPRMVKIVHESVASAAAAGPEIDLMTQIARPIPYKVVAELVGLPETEDDSLLVEASRAFTSVGQEPFLELGSVDELRRLNGLLSSYIEEAVEWKRKHLGEDVLSNLLTADEDGHPIPTDEIVAEVRHLFVAGHETTVNLIGNGVLALMRDRAEWERIVREPHLIPGAVEELLRYDGTVQLLWRTARRDVELGDVVIPAGDDVVAWVGSANHDPGKFGDSADELDVSRENANQHITFGHGVHNCIGSWLARAEMKEFLQLMAAKYPAFEVDVEEPEWDPRVGVRGLLSLPCRLQGGG